MNRWLVLASVLLFWACWPLLFHAHVRYRGRVLPLEIVPEELLP